MPVDVQIFDPFWTSLIRTLQQTLHPNKNENYPGENQQLFRDLK
jgi:hypothetical protein